MIFTKYKEGVRAIRAIKYKKYVAWKYTRARAPLAREYTNRIFESKDGTTSMKIVNYIERHNFCWNDFLTKFNRTETKTYKVEERTFGTPCICSELETCCVKKRKHQQVSSFYHFAAAFKAESRKKEKFVDDIKETLFTFYSFRD